jgi:hypothetical protein
MSIGALDGSMQHLIPSRGSPSTQMAVRHAGAGIGARREGTASLKYLGFAFLYATLRDKPHRRPAATLGDSMHRETAGGIGATAAIARHD